MCALVVCSNACSSGAVLHEGATSTGCLGGSTAPRRATLEKGH